MITVLTLLVFKGWKFEVPREHDLGTLEFRFKLLFFCDLIFKAVLTLGTSTKLGFFVFLIPTNTTLRLSLRHKARNTKHATLLLLIGYAVSGSVYSSSAPAQLVPHQVVRLSPSG